MQKKYLSDFQYKSVYLTVYYAHIFLTIPLLSHYTLEMSRNSSFPRNGGAKEKKSLTGPRYTHESRGGGIHGQLFPGAAARRERDRLSVDIFHGNGNCHECTDVARRERGKEAIESSRISEKGFYFLGLLFITREPWTTHNGITIECSKRLMLLYTIIEPCYPF